MSDMDSPRPDQPAGNAGARLDQERRDAASTFQEVREDLGHKAHDIVDDVKQAAGDRTGSMQRDLGATLKALGDAVQAAGDSLSGNGQKTASRVAGEVAGGLSRLSASVSRKPLGEVVEDVRDFGRQNGSALFATAMLAGLAVGRLLRSGEAASAEGGAAGRQTGGSRDEKMSRASRDSSAGDAAAASSEHDRHMGMGEKQ